MILALTVIPTGNIMQTIMQKLSMFFTGIIAPTCAEYAVINSIEQWAA